MRNKKIKIQYWDFQLEGETVRDLKAMKGKKKGKRKRVDYSLKSKKNGGIREGRRRVSWLDEGFDSSA